MNQDEREQRLSIDSAVRQFVDERFTKPFDLTLSQSKRLEWSLREFLEFGLSKFTSENKAQVESVTRLLMDSFASAVVSVLNSASVVDSGGNGE